MTAMYKLTLRQERFAHEFVIDLNASQAAVRAGFSKKTAYSQGQRLLKNVEVQKIIQKAQNKATDMAGIDATYVLRQAKELFERCMEKIEPVMVNGVPLLNGEGRVVYKFDSAGACKALDILAKHRGVMAYVPEAAPPPAPDGGSKWTVEVVHMTKDDYYRAIEKPPIEHNP
jgi:phage terminase small subunit